MDCMIPVQVMAVSEPSEFKIIKLFQQVTWYQSSLNATATKFDYLVCVDIFTLFQ